MSELPIGETPLRAPESTSADITKTSRDEEIRGIAQKVLFLILKAATNTEAVRQLSTHASLKDLDKEAQDFVLYKIHSSGNTEAHAIIAALFGR